MHAIWWISIWWLSAFAVEPPIKDSVLISEQNCSLQNKAYAPGEKMVFKFYYNWKALWLSAGEMTFRVDTANWNGMAALHLRVDGATYKSYEWFYRVRDVYESYINPSTLKPYRFARDVDEGGFIIKETYDFAATGEEVVTYDFKKQPAIIDTFQVHDCVHDVVSAIYFARNIDYSQYTPGDKIPIDVFIDRKVYSLYIRYVGRTIVKTKLGKFDTYMIKPLLIDNDYFEGGEEMTLYVTADDNQIPVRIESPLTVGWVKVDLLRFGNLRHPFEARH